MRLGWYHRPNPEDLIKNQMTEKMTKWPKKQRTIRQNSMVLNCCFEPNIWSEFHLVNFAVLKHQQYGFYLFGHPVDLMTLSLWGDQNNRDGWNRSSAQKLSLSLSLDLNKLKLKMSFCFYEFSPWAMVFNLKNELIHQHLIIVKFSGLR